MTEKMKLFTITIICLLLVGCGTMNTVKEMPAEIDLKVKNMQCPSGESLVYVVRPTFVGKPFGGTITANNELVGVTQGGIYIYAVLNPGEYIFKVTGHDNDSEVTVNLVADNTYYIHQGVYPGLLKGTTKLKLLNEEEGRKKLEECVLGDKLGKNISH